MFEELVTIISNTQKMSIFWFWSVIVCSILTLVFVSIGWYVEGGWALASFFISLCGYIGNLIGTKVFKKLDKHNK